MNGWKSDKDFSDRSLPEIKQILGLYLIGEPPEVEDTQHNTDLMVLTMSAVRIGCRIRRHGYLKRYGHEFTIRAQRDSGMKTELAKILEGWGNYFFYGHAGDNGELAAWALCDLNVFRLWFNQSCCKNKGQWPGKQKANQDGSSDFLAFEFKELPSEFIVARKTAFSDQQELFSTEI